MSSIMIKHARGNIIIIITVRISVSWKKKKNDKLTEVWLSSHAQNDPCDSQSINLTRSCLFSLPKTIIVNNIG